MAKKRAAKRAARRKSSGLNLSAPKQLTWIIAVAAGVLGLLSAYGGLALGVEPFILVAIGFVLLTLGSLFEGI